MPNGMAYITDLGCCAALNSMLGMQTSSVLHKLVTQMPSKFVVEENGPFVLHGVCIKADVVTGKAISIERIRLEESSIIIDNDTAGKE